MKMEAVNNCVSTQKARISVAANWDLSFFQIKNNALSKSQEEIRLSTLPPTQLLTRMTYRRQTSSPKSVDPVSLGMTVS